MPSQSPPGFADLLGGSAAHGTIDRESSNDGAVKGQRDAARNRSRKEDKVEDGPSGTKTSTTLPPAGVPNAPSPTWSLQSVVTGPAETGNAELGSAETASATTVSATIVNAKTVGAVEAAGVLSDASPQGPEPIVTGQLSGGAEATDPASTSPLFQQSVEDIAAPDAATKTEEASAQVGPMQTAPQPMKNCQDGMPDPALLKAGVAGSSDRVARGPAPSAEQSSQESETSVRSAQPSPPLTALTPGAAHKGPPQTAAITASATPSADDLEVRPQHASSAAAARPNWLATADQVVGRASIGEPLKVHLTAEKQLESKPLPPAGLSLAAQSVNGTAAPAYKSDKNPAEDDTAHGSSSSGVDAVNAVPQGTLVAAGAVAPVVAVASTPVVTPQSTTDNLSCTVPGKGIKGATLDKANAGSEMSLSQTEVSDRPQLASINTAKLVQSMAQTEMRIGMRSDEFGSLTIHTTLGREQISAQISLESEKLGSALSAHLPSIQEKLSQDYGVKASVTIGGLGGSGSLGSGSDRSPDGRSGNQSGGQAPQYSALSKETYSPVLGLNPATTSASMTERGRLDIRI